MEPHKKSGGQLGDAQTSVDSNPQADAAQQAERGAKTAENIRYGQGISEQGMGGQTTTSSGEAGQEGYGQMADQAEEMSGKGDRVAEGYGGDKDMARDIGA